MLDGVYLGRIILGARNDLQLVGQRIRLDDQRVVAHHLERTPDVRENALAVVGDA